MKKSIIITSIQIAFGIILMGFSSCSNESNRKELGEGPLKCYVEGELMTDKFGDNIVIYDVEALMQGITDDRSFRVKAIDGKFYMTINTEQVSQYEVALYKQVKTGNYMLGQFLTENNAHIKVQVFEDKIAVRSDGEEGRKHELMDSIVAARFQNTDTASDSIEAFRINYYAEHPMLWALYYDVLNAAQCIHRNTVSPGIIPDTQLKAYESYMNLYYEILYATYPDNPIHKQITELTSLCPGQPYFDYDIHTPDGDAVPISSLIKGQVALIDLWASWCGPCRKHSKAMIPIYEKYKDKGFTVIAVAREKDRSSMEQALEKDGYPWSSYLEPMNDENHVWSRNGIGPGGGGMILVDRDGTILSISYEAEVLEPLIKKALDVN